MLLNNTT